MNMSEIFKLEVGGSYLIRYYDADSKGRYVERVEEAEFRNFYGDDVLFWVKKEDKVMEFHYDNVDVIKKLF